MTLLSMHLLELYIHPLMMILPQWAVFFKSHEIGDVPILITSFVVERAWSMLPTKSESTYLESFGLQSLPYKIPKFCVFLIYLIILFAASRCDFVIVPQIFQPFQWQIVYLVEYMWDASISLQCFCNALNQLLLPCLVLIFIFLLLVLMLAYSSLFQMHLRCFEHKIFRS